MSLTVDQIWSSLDSYARQYVKFGSESIRINSHTHQLGDDASPPKEVLNKCLGSFIDFCKQDRPFWEGQTTPQQILDTLVGFARSFPKQKEGTKAIIVDFINYVGAMNGINYALQTSDIYERIPE